MLVLGVLEEIADALLFHQPAEEIEFRLAILYAVLARLVALLQDEAVIVPAKTGILQDLLDDLPDIHLLEDAAVMPVRQVPQPGHQRGVVGREANALVALLEATHQGMQVAWLVVAVDHQQGWLINDAGEINLMVFAGQFQVEPVGTRELLHPAQADHMDLVFQRSYPEREPGGVCVQVCHEIFSCLDYVRLP